jgi:Sugar (and other) transporter
MALASLANWLFNFALGLFVPPAFRTITWKTFITFGVLCLGAAAQAFVSYPETARKSLEEIENMFRNGGPRPWHTKVGDSHLEERIAAVKAGQEKPTTGDLSNQNGPGHEVRRSVEDVKPSTETHNNYGIEKV